MKPVILEQIPPELERWFEEQGIPNRVKTSVRSLQQLQKTNNHELLEGWINHVRKQVSIPL